DKLVKNKDPFAPRVVSDGQTLLLDSKTAGDEPFMLANNLKGVVVIVDRARAKASSFATKHFGVDVIILDDGLQYLRLKRKINLVLVDSQAPFGNGYLLPRGMLREPPANLARATHVLLTKCQEPNNHHLISLIRRFNPTAEIIECAHRPREARNILTGERLSLEALQGMRAGAISGIAVPESFESALNNLGVELILTEQYADHHRFNRDEIESFVRKCSRKKLDGVFTTEKDAVRFPRILDPLVPIFCLRVEIEILTGHEAWQSLLNLFLNKRHFIAPAVNYGEFE
ncbi:MAG: tetraacyldisaccharide 4'-kinase, partial [Chthoniobacterales bacterium]|nr:tetraacyldisaccharide 4'-kinase [Chthoniobacterales bacterium]